VRTVQAQGIEQRNDEQDKRAVAQIHKLFELRN
jgi:hypothetical protein